VKLGACLLGAAAVVEDGGGEGDAAEVGDGLFVVVGGDAAPVLEASKAASGGVAPIARVGVEAWWPSAE
jgi:hypothetical protein